MTWSLNAKSLNYLEMVRGGDGQSLKYILGWWKVGIFEAWKIYVYCEPSGQREIYWINMIDNNTAVFLVSNFSQILV